MNSRYSPSITWAMRSTSASRSPRCRAAISSTSAPRGMPMASATSAPRKPSAPCAFSQPAIERRPVDSTGFVGTAGAATALMQTHARTAASQPRMVPSLSCPLFYGLRGVFLGDLVVEEAGRVRRRHEAPVDLGVDADVLVDLPVGHLDFERLRGLVVAHRAQLRGIDALSLHQIF